MGLSISPSSLSSRFVFVFGDEEDRPALRCRVSGKTRVIAVARVIRTRERRSGIHGLVTMSEPAMGPDIMRAVR